MDSRQARYLIGGLILLGLGIYYLATYTSVHSYQLTFNILSGQAQGFPTTRNPQDIVTGSFQETSGNPVSFYIQNSAQYAAFQTGSFTGSVFSVQDVPSGSFSYTFTLQDTYYLLFRHGTGLISTTETIYFQRSYQIHSNFRLVIGIACLALTPLEFYLGFRPRKSHLAPSPPPVPAPGPTGTS